MYNSYPNRKMKTRRKKRMRMIFVRNRILVKTEVIVFRYITIMNALVNGNMKVVIVKTKNNLVRWAQTTVRLIKSVSSNTFRMAAVMFVILLE